jgi:chromosomal replication initiator protein
MNAPLDARTAWERCLAIIQDNVSPQAFVTWFRPIDPITLDQGQLTIQVKSHFFVDWLEEHYYTLLQSSIKEVIGPEALLSYAVVVDDEPGDSREQVITLPARTAPAPAEAESSAAPLPSLNPRYLFDTFVKGESNQFAYAAAVAVANNPGKTRYNPLIMYGGVGLGKTHLMQAIGNAIISTRRDLQVVYISSERFTIEFVDAIQNNRRNEFASFYRSVDVLLIDDIQFFAGKERTQDSFFHTFNELHHLDKQIVLTSDRPPSELKGVDDRLISRFQWGLTTDIQLPDLETRIAIIQKKAENEGMDIPDDVIEFIARYVTSNVRELEGCLISVLARASIEGREITIDLAQDVLRSIAVPIKTQLTIQDIQAAVSVHFQISESLLLAKTRKQEIARARQVAMFLCKELTRHSLKTIGMHFGGRDHSTVIHACQTVIDEIQADPILRRAVDQIRQELNTTSTGRVPARGILT